MIWSKCEFTVALLFNIDFNFQIIITLILKMKIMKNLKTIFIVICLIVLNNNIYSQEIQNDKLKQKIDVANKIIDKASLEYDYETWAKYYTDDVIILPNNEPMIQGKQAFIENEKKAEKAGFKVISIKSTLVKLFSSGDLIHEVGKYEITLKVPGVPFDIVDTGKYLVIWETQDDESIKIKLETWNNDKERE